MLSATIRYYLDLLLSQFQKSQRINDLLIALLEPYEETHQVLQDLMTRRYVDTAEGVWQDVVGIIIGRPRPPQYDTSGTFFEFKSVGGVDDPNKGFGDALSPGSGGRFQSFFGTSLGIPEADGPYRVLQKGKINSMLYAGTIPEIYDYIFETFGKRTHPYTAYPGMVYIEVLEPIDQGTRREIERYIPLLAGVNVGFIN